MGMDEQKEHGTHFPCKAGHRGDAHFYWLLHDSYAGKRPRPIRKNRGYLVYPALPVAYMGRVVFVAYRSVIGCKTGAKAFRFTAYGCMVPQQCRRLCPYGYAGCT